MKKNGFAKLTALVLSLMMVFTLTAALAEDSDLAYVQNKGTLIVGITDFEPMDYMVDGDWTGFDAELARMVGEKLGVEVAFQEINWSMKETELAGYTIDCIWNGLTWNEERAENMGLTDAYMINRQVIVVREGASYASAADFAGVTVAAESGSAGEDYIKAVLPDAEFIEKDAQIDALTELRFGTVDAAVLDYIMAYYLINAEGSDFASLSILEGDLQGEEEYYAIAFRKGSDLVAKVNEILAELKEDGTVADIAQKYGLEGAIV